MSGWQSVDSGGKIWSDTHSNPMSLRQYANKSAGARPPPEFKISVFGKVDIRTGARVLRLRGHRAISERYNRRFNDKDPEKLQQQGKTVLQIMMTKRSVAFRDAEHSFDKAINRLVTNIANGDITNKREIAEALNQLCSKHRDLQKASDGNFDCDRNAKRAVVNLEESLHALQAAGLGKHMKTVMLLRDAIARLAKNPPKGLSPRGIDGDFAQRLLKKLNVAVNPKPKSDKADTNDLDEAEAEFAAKFMGNDEYADEELGWRGTVLFDAPDLDGIKETSPDKFQGGEGHVSMLKTKDGRRLAGKVERSDAAGHLSHEFEAYQEVYKANGGKPHPNLGKAYGIAMAKFGDKTERMLMMDEVPGFRGNTTMRALHEAWQKGEISNDEYWGTVQFLSRRLLGVNQLINKAGITHNDIKPENFVVDKTTGEPVLLDFGLSSKIGDKSGGATDEFLAPEVFNDKWAATEKSDVFSIGATLLECTEQMPRGDQRDVKPYQGLNVTQKGYRTNKYGVPEHAPGMAGAETAYTRFMGRALDEDPKTRPTSVQAAQLDFLADAHLSDDAAKAVIVKVLAKVPEDTSGMSAIDRLKLEREGIHKDLNITSLKEATLALNRAPKRHLQDDQFQPGRILPDMSIGYDLIAKSAHTGQFAHSAQQLKKAMIELAQTTTERANGQKSEALGKFCRGEIHSQTKLLLEEAKEFLGNDDDKNGKPYRPVEVDKDRIEILAAWARMQISLEKLAGADDNNADIMALEDTANKLDALRHQMDAMRNDNKKTLERLEQSLDGWNDEAAAILKRFDSNKPRMQSGVEKTPSGHMVQMPKTQLAAADQAIKTGKLAEKAKAEAAYLEDDLRTFADEAQAFLAGPGRGGFSTKELQRLRDGLTTARRLLNLDRDWIQPAKHREVDQKQFVLAAESPRPNWVDQKPSASQSAKTAILSNGSGTAKPSMPFVPPATTASLKQTKASVKKRSMPAEWRITSSQLGLVNNRRQGLPNVGASCYLNSALNMAASVPQYRQLFDPSRFSSSDGLNRLADHLYERSDDPQKKRNDAKWMHQAVQYQALGASIDEVLHNIDIESSSTTKQMINLRDAMFKLDLVPPASQQFDPGEILLSKLIPIFDIDSDLNVMEVTEAVIGENPNNGLPFEMGQASKSTVELDITGVDDLESAIAKYQEYEEFDDHDLPLQANQHQGVVGRFERQKLVGTPNVLSFTLKRDKFNEAGQRAIRIPEQLHFNGATYALKAAVTHHGEYSDRGHYTCLTERNATWTNHDDADLGDVAGGFAANSNAELKKNMGTFFTYVKVDPQQPLPASDIHRVSIGSEANAENEEENLTIVPHGFGQKDRSDSMQVEIGNELPTDEEFETDQTDLAPNQTTPLSSEALKQWDSGPDKTRSDSLNALAGDDRSSRKTDDIAPSSNHLSDAKWAPLPSQGMLMMYRNMDHLRSDRSRFRDREMRLWRAESFDEDRYRATGNEAASNLYQAADSLNWRIDTRLSGKSTKLRNVQSQMLRKSGIFGGMRKRKNSLDYYTNETNVLRRLNDSASQVKDQAWRAMQAYHAYAKLRDTPPRDLSAQDFQSQLQELRVSCRRQIKDLNTLKRDLDSKITLRRRQIQQTRSSVNLGQSSGLKAVDGYRKSAAGLGDSIAQVWTRLQQDEDFTNRNR